MYGYGFAPYVSVAVKKEMAKKEQVKLLKKDPEFQVVELPSKKIASTFWGKAWNENLQSYSDFDNRISRGKTYVRNGFVLGIKISKGVVESFVQGSKKKPYSVRIVFSEMKEDKYKQIIEKCNQSITSLSDLISGNFSEEFCEFFLNQDTGLFPDPEDIRFSCSCPDYAYMCKHVTAVMYALSVLLDANPLLFFKLRGVDVDSLIQKVAEEKVEKILKTPRKRTRRVVVEDDDTVFD